MKSIYLIRHAKSSWENPKLSDHQRPLNKRGLRDAPIMGQKLKNLYLPPDKIICSSAKRAKQTAELIEKKWLSSKSIESSDLLYEQPISSILNLIQSNPEDFNSLALVFHNPTVTQITNLLCSSSFQDVPTCSVLVISCNKKKWSSVDIGTCNLVNFEYPKK